VEARGKREEITQRMGQQPTVIPVSESSINQSINHILLLHIPINKHRFVTATHTKAAVCSNTIRKTHPLTSSQSGGESFPFSQHHTFFWLDYNGTTSFVARYYGRTQFLFGASSGIYRVFHDLRA